MARTERSAPVDEKITVNLGPVDLGNIDLLVSEGFYGSRTDLIRSAVRRVLDDHRRTLEDLTTRREFTAGYLRYAQADLKQYIKDGEQLDLRVIGLVQLASDVTPDVADKAIARLWVLGSLRAPAPVIERLRPKLVRQSREATS
jgi:Arc/MetJ-type ribon-helix-helix transcriptional regulator